MSYRIFVRKKAESQILEAYTWHEQKQVHLGDVFLRAIEDQFSRIEVNPFLFQLKYKNVHLAQTKKFPYGIFYLVDGDKIIVIAVFHLSRNPSLWKKLKS